MAANQPTNNKKKPIIKVNFKPAVKTQLATIQETKIEDNPGPTLDDLFGDDCNMQDFESMMQPKDQKLKSETKPSQTLDDLFGEDCDSANFEDFEEE